MAHRALGETLAGRPRVILFSGEPGIGKTRIVEEVAAEAGRRGAEVLFGRCYEDEGAPAFWPWVQVFRAYARSRSDAELARALGNDAGELAQLVPELADRLPDVPALSRNGESARFRLFDAVARVIARSARSRPLAIVFDDLQGADHSSLLLLNFVARHLHDSPLLLIGSFRDVALTRDHPLADPLADLVREPICERSSLRGLGTTDVAQFIEAVADVVPPAALAAQIRERTDGNPLFITELVGLLAETGRLERMAHGEAADVPIPESVRAAIGRRLGRLSDGCVDALRWASIFGREFREDVLAQLTRLPSESLKGHLLEASAARIVGAAPDGPGRYRFAHALTREVLYDEFPATRRSELLLRAAETLEAVSSSEREPPLAELATLFLAADDPRGVDYARRAADRALGMLAFEEAARQYERALHGVERAREADEGLRCEILLGLGEARNRAGQIEASKEVVLLAAESARRRDAREQLSHAALGFGAQFAWGESAGIDETRVALLEEAIAAWGSDDHALHARLLGRLAASLYFAPEAGARRAKLADAGVAMARRVGDREARAFALDAQHSAIWRPGNARERSAIAAELVEMAHTVRDPAMAFQGHFWKFCDHLELGDAEALGFEFDHCRRLATRLRDPHLEFHLALLRALRALVAGRLSEVETEIAGFGAFAPRWWGFIAQQAIGLYSLALGMLRGGLDPMVEGWRANVELHPAAPTARCTLAYLYAEVGRLDEARREYASFLPDGVKHLPNDGNLVVGFAFLAEVCARLGDASGAVELYGLMLPHAGSCVAIGNASGFFGAVDLYLGMLAATAGRAAEADAHLEEALRIHARLGARPFLARTQYEIAALIVSGGGSGGTDRARQMLAEARATAAALGMAPLEHKIAELADSARAILSVDAPRDGDAVGTVRSTRTGSPRAPVDRDECGSHIVGETWLIEFDGIDTVLPDTRGMRYLVRLLDHPWRELNAPDVVRAGQNGGESIDEASLPASDDGLAVREGLGDAGTVVDDQARREYRARLAELQATLEEAERSHDLERSRSIQAERASLAAHLSAAFGMSGRSRKVGSDVERARVALTKRLKETIRRIETVSPALGRHLADSIRTGKRCGYFPQPGARVAVGRRSS